MKNKHTPEIRFAGFTDAWEQREVSTFSGETYGGGTPQTSNEAYWEGEIPWIQSSDLKEHKVFGVEPNKGVSQLGLKNSATKLVPANSIAIITRVGVGKLAFMPFEYATSQDFLSLSKLKVDGWFATYSLYKKLQSESHAVQGTSIKGITKDELLKKSMMVPISNIEQSKIGAFFKSLDNLITLHQRELTTLKQTKQGFLQKMFPREGETVPEVRFPGFTDAWEQRELGELANFTKGVGYTKSDLRETGSPIILYGRLYTDYKTLIEDVNTFVDMKENSVISLGGEVIVPSSGESAEDIARASVVGKPGIILGGDLNIIKPIGQIDPVFLALAISNGAPNKDMEKRAQGKSVVHLHNSDIKKINLVFPQVKEQRIIVNFYLQLDHLITLHQRELDALKETKRAFLQKMFV
ncbi:restriction endonuclease subunit S [Paenibacillus odorifer]|uniref:Type I restriction modification DNA specificity domain-containing protein n=1 Tax=Paenibacillus odorifer TaxID=189426 RepID=A0A1R0XKS0_9BACL|nr:restriction endonuclease subunit S [Paenibacillus odorifer]OMD35652.1 hypothetical protein BSK52_26495 [Paenibacillus odorifer]